MRFNDLLIGWWGLFREVHRADVLGRVLKNKLPPPSPLSAHHWCPPHIILYNNISAWVYVLVFASVWYFRVEVCVSMCPCMIIQSSPRLISQPPTPVDTYTHPHMHIRTGYFRSLAPDRASRSINYISAPAIKQGYYQACSSPTWKGLANQRLL